MCMTQTQWKSEITSWQMFHTSWHFLKIYLLWSSEIQFRAMKWVCSYQYYFSKLIGDEFACRYYPATQTSISLNHKGGVHICRVAYGDLTWENSSYPKSHTQWYNVGIGHYIHNATWHYQIYCLQGVCSPTVSAAVCCIIFHVNPWC